MREPQIGEGWHRIEAVGRKWVWKAGGRNGERVQGGKEGHLTVRVDKERVSMTEMPSMAPVTGEEGVVGVSMTIQVLSGGGVGSLLGMGGSLEMLSTKEVDNPIQLSGCHHNSAVGMCNQ